MHNNANHGDGFYVAASPSQQSRACWRRYEADEKHEFFGDLVHQILKVELFNLKLFFAVTWFGSLALSAV